MVSIITINLQKAAKTRPPTATPAYTHTHPVINANEFNFTSEIDPNIVVPTGMLDFLPFRTFWSDFNKYFFRKK